MNMPHPTQAGSETHHWSLLWDPIHINEWDLHGSDSIEVHLNLLNAALRFSLLSWPVRLRSADTPVIRC